MKTDMTPQAIKRTGDSRTTACSHCGAIIYLTGLATTSHVLCPRCDRVAGVTVEPSTARRVDLILGERENMQPPGLDDDFSFHLGKYRAIAFLLVGVLMSALLLVLVWRVIW